MTSYGVDSAKLKAARENLPPINLASFVDPRKPWVMVPNGSLLGFFDWVCCMIHDTRYMIIRSIALFLRYLG